MPNVDQDDSVVHKVTRRAVDEARRYLILFFYLWALFFLFVLNEDIVLRRQGVSITVQGFALFNSLVLAKVMLVAEDLDPGRWLRRRPLIFPIVQDALLLTALFICFHILEHVVIGLFAKESIAASVPHIGGGGLLGLILVAAILFISLLPFFAFKHISRELGKHRMYEILFGTSVGGRESQR